MADDVNVKVSADIADATSQIKAFSSEGTAAFQAFAQNSTGAFNQFSSAAQNAASQTNQAAQAAQATGGAFNQTAAGAAAAGGAAGGAIPPVAGLGAAMGAAGAAAGVAGSTFNFFNITINNIPSAANAASSSVLGLSTRIGLLSAAYLALRVIRGVWDSFDGAREAVVKLDQLATATGVYIVVLAELKKAMDSVGANNDNLAQNLQRLTKNMETAREGGQKQMEAFRMLGVDTARLKSGTIEVDEVIQQVAKHLSSSTKDWQDSAEVQTLFGRNTVALESFLKTQGTTLKELMDKHKDYATAVKNSSQASKELTEMQAHLKEQFDIFLLSTLPSISEGLKTDAQSWVEIKEDIKIAADMLLLFGKNVETVFTRSAKAGALSLEGNFKGAVEYIKGTFAELQENSRSVDKLMEEDSRDASKAIMKIWQDNDKMLAGRAKQSSGNTDPSGDVHLADRRRELELQGQQEHNVRFLTEIKKFYEGMEKLGEINAFQNLDRLKANNDEILNTEKYYLEQRIAIAKSDPKSGTQVESLNNAIKAVEDKHAAESLSLDLHVAEVKKHNMDEVERSGKALTEHMLAEEEKAARKREEIGNKLIEQGRAAAERSSQDALRASELKTQAEEIHAIKTQELYRKSVEDQFGLNLISLKKRDELLRQSFDSETKLQKDAAQKELADLDTFHAEYLRRRMALETKIAILVMTRTGDAAGYLKELEQLDAFNASYLTKEQQLQDKLGVLRDRERSQEQTAHEKELKVLTQRYGAFINDVGNAFQTGVMGWIKGTKTFSEAWRGMLADTLTGWIGTLLQMMVKDAERWALHKVLALAGFAVDTAANTTAKTAEVATSKVATDVMILDAAFLAAANAYAANAWDPPGATAAASIAFGAVASMISGTAEKGAIVPSNQLMMLHAKEMVLPAHLSTGVQNLINSGGNSTTSSSRGGDTHLHAYFSPQISTVDSSGFSELLDKHESVFVQKMSRIMRNNHMSDR